MPRIIYKAQVNDLTKTIRVSSDAFRVLHVDTQRNVPTIWYETVVDPVTTQDITFTAVMTGETVPENGIYLGTCQIESELIGEIVIHIYQT